MDFPLYPKCEAVADIDGTTHKGTVPLIGMISCVKVHFNEFLRNLKFACYLHLVAFSGRKQTENKTITVLQWYSPLICERKISQDFLLETASVPINLNRTTSNVIALTGSIVSEWLKKDIVFKLSTDWWAMQTTSTHLFDLPYSHWTLKSISW